MRFPYSLLNIVPLIFWYNIGFLLFSIWRLIRGGGESYLVHSLPYLDSFIVVSVYCLNDGMRMVEMYPISCMR